MFLIKNWKQTDGVITGSEQEFGEEGDYSYWVTYQADGKEYRSVMDRGREGLYGIGQQVTVAYDPDKPRKCMNGARQKLAAAGQTAKLAALAVIVLLVLWVRWLFS